MGMTLKELLTKGEGTLSAQEAKDLAAQCRMDVETLYTLLEERGIKILDNEVEADTSLDVDSIIAEVENAENNSDGLPRVTSNVALAVVSDCRPLLWLDIRTRANRR